MMHFLQKDTSESPENCKKLAESPTNLANTSFTDANQILSVGTNDLPPKKRTSTRTLNHDYPHTSSHKLHEHVETSTKIYLTYQLLGQQKYRQPPLEGVGLGIGGVWPSPPALPSREG